MTTDTDSQRLWLLLSLGRHRDLEAFARECIGRQPEWGLPYTYLGQALTGLGRAREGIQPAETGIGKNPHDPWMHATLAHILLCDQEYLRAADAAQEALRLDPNYPWPFAILAEVERKLGECRRSVQTARAGLAVGPTHEGLQCQLGWSLIDLGNTQEAGEVAKRGLEQHPNSPCLHNLAGWACHAQATAAKSRLPVYRRAEGHFATAVRSNPVEPAYRENRETNAIAARKYTLQFVWLAAVGVAFALFGLTFLFCKINSNCDVMIVPVVLQIGWLIAVGLWVCQSRTAILTAPLAWLNVPTIPHMPTEQRFGRLVWGVIVSVDLALVAVTIGLGIYALCRGS